MIGAKKVGSAPWSLAGGRGYEAEIVLPKKNPRRLWAGILAYDFVVLHFMVTHPKEERQQFEPLATDIITSLSFLAEVPGLATSPVGLPLPPGYQPVDPTGILDDISDPEDWLAYDGDAPIPALQAFYLREAPNYGRQLEEYVPYPSHSGLGFARLRLVKDEQVLGLGLLPYAPASGEIPLGRVAVKKG